MAEGQSDPLDRQTLRHWPWLALCLLGAVVFGLLAAWAGYELSRASSVGGYVVTGGLTLGLGALVVYSLASLRTRTVLDESGSTAVEAFSRTHVPWSRVARLEVIHSLPGWAVRAWTADGDPVAVYLCHDTHGRRPKSPRTFERPPGDAPVSLHRGFTQIERYWHAVAGRPAGSAH